MDKVKYFFQQSWLLIIASFFFGLLIAVANAAWQDNILRNEENKFNDLVREMIPDANTSEIVLEDVEVDSGKGKKKLTSVRKVLSAEGQRVGWAFMCEGSGFADKIRLVIAADSEFEKFFGFKVLSSYETPGFGSKIAEDDPESNEDLVDEFKDAPVGEFVLVKTGKRRENESQPNDNVIIAISGATVSSDAVVKIFNAYTDKVRDELQEKGLIGNGE